MLKKKYEWNGFLMTRKLLHYLTLTSKGTEETIRKPDNQLFNIITRKKYALMVDNKKGN